MRKKQDERNGVISLWKFIFAIVILCYHSKWLFPDLDIPVFFLGYIGVEYFFNSNRLLFYEISLKNKNKTTKTCERNF